MKKLTMFFSVVSFLFVAVVGIGDAAANLISCDRGVLARAETLDGIDIDESSTTLIGDWVAAVDGESEYIDSEGGVDWAYAAAEQESAIYETGNQISITAQGGTDTYVNRGGLYQYADAAAESYIEVYFSVDQQAQFTLNLTEVWGNFAYVGLKNVDTEEFVFIYDSEFSEINNGILASADYEFIAYAASHDTELTYYDASLVVTAVPIPGAFWLLGSGLIGIVGIRKKYNK
jgi:hypothetical protein